jgi:hypothetical protein
MNNNNLDIKSEIPHQKQRRLSDFALTKGYTDGGTTVIQEEFFDSGDSSIELYSDNDSSARGSITQSIGSSSLIEPGQRTLTRNKTEGDLHMLPTMKLVDIEEPLPQ